MNFISKGLKSGCRKIVFVRKMIALLAHSNEFEVSTKNSFSRANKKQSSCPFNTKITIF
jgi:hypothetical protein